jgi:hypothetical protein
MLTILLALRLIPCKIRALSFRLLPGKTRALSFRRFTEAKTIMEKRQSFFASVKRRNLFVNPAQQTQTFYTQSPRVAALAPFTLNKK